MSSKLMLIAAMVLALGCGVACSDSSDTPDDGLGAKGFKITGTTTDSSGAASVSCDKREQTISLVFSVREDYTISLDGCDWMSIISGGEGVAGTSRTLKVKVSQNSTDITRFGDIFINVGKNNKALLAKVSQTAVSSNAIVDWMDERLSKEYYWLTEYNQMKENGEINYKIEGQQFLDDNLMRMGSVNLDDGYYDQDGKRHLYTYIREYSQTKVDPDAVKTKGYGIELCYTIISFQNSPNYAFLIEHVYIDSPAYIAGFRRGDMIKEVNGSPINNSNYENLFYQLLSGSGSISVGKVIERADGSEAIVSFDINATEYYPSPIACSMMLEESVEDGFDFEGKKIGYISYLTFDYDYNDELIQAIVDMQAEGVTDLIIDLRTNGGGAVYSASYFASMLVSQDLVGESMVELVRHKDNANGNEVVPFFDEVELSEEESVTLPHLNLPKVVFITSEDTASASELLIMSLRSRGVDAVTVGKQSAGKDCGMDVQRVAYGSKQYEFAPITFMNKFENYDVDFGEGIPADVDFNKIAEVESDEDLLFVLDWFPLPSQDVDWGEYLEDVALCEAVANILGGSIITTPSAKAKFSSPIKLSTRASSNKGMKKAVEIERPAVKGMYVQHKDVCIEIKE